MCATNRIAGSSYSSYRRGIAQPGSAPAWGAGGRKFESFCPDQFLFLYCIPTFLYYPYFYQLYSVRKASTGSSRAAYRAGRTPASRPMVMDIISARSTKFQEICTGRAGKLKCRSWAMPMPRNRPARPPIAASIMASPRNRLGRKNADSHSTVL